MWFLLQLRLATRWVAFLQKAQNDKILDILTLLNKGKYLKFWILRLTPQYDKIY